MLTRRTTLAAAAALALAALPLAATATVVRAGYGAVKRA